MDIQYGVARLSYNGGKCLACGKSFTVYTSARRHFQLVHHEAEAKECHVCNRFYKNALGLRQHLRHAHGIYQSMVKVMNVPNSSNL